MAFNKTLYVIYLVFLYFQTGNHVRLQDIDLELGEVCTAINQYAMAKNNRWISEYFINLDNMYSQNAGLRPAMLAITVSVRRGS